MLIPAPSLLIDTELYIPEGKEEGLPEGSARLEDHMCIGCVPNQRKCHDFPVVNAEPAKTITTHKPRAF